MPRNLYKTLIVFMITLSPASLTFARKAKSKSELWRLSGFVPHFFRALSIHEI